MDRNGNQSDEEEKKTSVGNQCRPKTGPLADKTEYIFNMRQNEQKKATTIN